MAKFNYGGQAVIEGVMMRGRSSAVVAIRREDGGILLRDEDLRRRFYTNPITRWPFVRGLVLLWDMLILGSRIMMFSGNFAVRDGQAGGGAMAADGAAPALAPIAPIAPAGLAAQPNQPPSADTTPQAPQTAPMATMAPATAALMSTTTPGSAAASAATVALPGARSRITESHEPLAGGARLVVTLLISLGFTVGLFFLLPLGVVALARPLVGGGWLSLALEGAIRLALLIGYLLVIGRFAEIERVFQYHGAEHKTINAYEVGDPLDVEHVRRASRVHTRCGTGFLLIVVIVSIFVFALIGSPPLALRIVSRVVLVPVIAAIAYELMRLGATYYRFRVVRWLMAPSLALQGLTTREPDDGQIECAIAALERVLLDDGEHAVSRVA